jgi:hypothetical protein
MNAASPETLPATIDGALKMPTPITMPTIIATASNTVSVGRGWPPAPAGCVCAGALTGALRRG